LPLTWQTSAADGRRKVYGDWTRPLSNARKSRRTLSQPVGQFESADC
jgi:hypothetical protein